MRTDAILINSTGNNELQKRMDRLGDSDNDCSPGFAMHGDRSKKASFEQVYNKVAQSNKTAMEKTENSVHLFKKSSVSEDKLQLLSEFLSGNGLQTTDGKNDEVAQTDEDFELTGSNETIMEQLAQMQLITGLPIEQNNVKTGGETAAKATQVIVDAVKKIAETLQINLVPEIEKFSLDTISSDTIDQFAEIVSVLKSITDVLEMAIENGQPLDTGRAVLGLEDVKGTADILRTELFKIQLGLNIVGIGEEVASEVSVKMDELNVNGINQATNPKNLSMPVEQIRKIFGNLFDGKENGTVEIDTKEAGSQDSSVGKFDAQTYRTLLKIEKEEKVISENTESVKNLDKMDIPLNAETVLASDPAEILQDEILPVVETVNKAFTGPDSANMESRISRALSKTTEQNVLSQLTDKFQQLVKSGDTEIRIQLRPESLGDVKLAIRIEGDVVVARIQVENQQVKQIVESNLQSLKDALAEQNLQAGSFDVNVGQGWGRHSEQSSQNLGSKQTTHGSEISNDSDDLNPLRGAPSGIDTGNRYGNNSIEYYA